MIDLSAFSQAALDGILAAIVVAMILFGVLAAFIWTR